MTNKRLVGKLAGLTVVTVIKVDRYDWAFPQTVCLQPMPVLRPSLVKAIIKAIPSGLPEGYVLGITDSLRDADGFGHPTVGVL